MLRCFYKYPSLQIFLGFCIQVQVSVISFTLKGKFFYNLSNKSRFVYYLKLIILKTNCSMFKWKGGFNCPYYLTIVHKCNNKDIIFNAIYYPRLEVRVGIMFRNVEVQTRIRGF